MNTITELVNDFNLNETVAKQVIDRYTEMIGMRYGINEIVDVTYTGNRHRDIKLRCTNCGKIRHMDYDSVKNCLLDIWKTCECQKSPKIKKAVIRNDDPSYIGKVYGTFKVIGTYNLHHKSGGGSTIMWNIRCVNCGSIKTGAPSVVRKGMRCATCTPKPVLKWVGQKINRLTILSTYKKDDSRFAHCVCECGKECDIQMSSIRSGRVKSCGCLAKELNEIRSANAVSSSPLYCVWNNMKQRCNNPNNDNYQNYGGRGISICDEWNDDFRAFETWAVENGYRPNQGLSIDRVDVNGNYCPENCRWTNIFVQNVNRRKPKPRKCGYTINGVSKTKKEWCKEYGVWQATVDYRMKKMGMTFEEALKAEKVTEGNHLAALNLPEPKAKQLDRLNKTNSYIEANLYMAFIRKGFGDKAVPQYNIGNYRVDFWIEDTNIVIECDGLEYHKDKDQLEADYKRERYLLANGYRVLRYTGSEINKDPDTVADEIIGFAKGGEQWQDRQMTRRAKSLECESIAT